MKARKIFLVDDDFIFREAAGILIKASGLSENIHHFENGLQAYEALVSLCETPNELPEILLLDINMPVMNGWELLEELQEADQAIRNQVQIHILTSSIAPGDLNLSKEYAFINGYVTKPLTKADLKKMGLGLLQQKV